MRTAIQKTSILYRQDLQLSFGTPQPQPRRVTAAAAAADATADACVFSLAVAAVDTITIG